MKRAWVALLMAGCTAARPAPPPAAPMTSIAVVAPEELASLLVGELTSSGRFRAARVEEGRRPKADAVVTVAITEFDPYDPPRLALAVRVQRGPGAGAGDLDRLTQAGVWGRAPRPADAASFDLLLDSRDLATREALRAFMRTQDPAASAFTGGREVLAVSSSYLRFAAHQVAARIAYDR